MLERIRLAVNSHGGGSHLQYQQVPTLFHGSPRLGLGFTEMTSSHAKKNSASIKPALLESVGSFVASSVCTRSGPCDDKHRSGDMFAFDTALDKYLLCSTFPSLRLLQRA